MATRIRKATHAATWYIDDPSKLGPQLDAWLEDAVHEGKDARESKRVNGIIAPHAGFRFSGSTAAHAYCHLLERTDIKRVFVLGPSHHVYLEGCALTSASHYETPFGMLPVDEEINEILMKTGKFRRMSMSVDEAEHSIEMHLPFIARTLKGQSLSLVPILVGNTNQNNNLEYGRLLAQFMNDQSNFFVISSDFCHWGARFRYQPHDASYGEIHDYIKHLDHEAIKLLEDLNATGFATYLESTKNTICGQHPISIIMQAVLALDGLQPAIRFVKYAQSGACKKKSESSVSYASAVVSRRVQET
uniref:Memolike protein putative n=1 Tax=Albugo laibachii Nc14 TaxID=890382 RepID=F0WBS4_9STRA|nr:memolike protein putative [Albugo laibachii Nc14]CCA20558.1 memolike protein putative [Albugo laibachii Nc14]|eukprot:CCA20558.1 memolike protein putative [Albugo laibachii Nc14]